MDAMLDAFRRAAETISFHPARLPLVSNLSGAPATDDELCSPDYWVSHVRRTVRFADGVRTLYGEGIRTFLELGPHGVLSALAHETIQTQETNEPDADFIPTLRKSRNEVDALLTALAGLHVRGVPVDWKAFFAPHAPKRVDLPTYAFQRERFWLDSPKHRSDNSASLGESGFWRAVEQGDIVSLTGSLGVNNETQQAALVTLLPALSNWRRQAQEENTVESWRYRIAWKPMDATPAPTQPTGRRLLLVTPAALAGGELESAMARGLLDRGVDVVLVTVDHNDADRARLAAKLRQTAGENTPNGILSLVGIEENPLQSHPSVPAGAALALALVQALGDLNVRTPLWVLTCGAVSIGDNDPLLSPLQAMLWGFGRVVGLEHPDRWGGLLDLPDRLDPEAVSRLLDVLDNAAGEDQLAIRPAGIFVRRLLRASLYKSGINDAYQPRGTILITGGTGAIGSHVARRLAARGAEHLVLISRRGMEAPGAANLLNELSSLGVRTTIVACDTADRRALAELVDRIDALGPPVQSVFHAGGVSSRHLPIAANTLDNLADAIANKAAGAQNLHSIFGHRQLDAFVLFSSIAGIWGSAQQAGYAAANAFLDALAEQRRGLGLKATAIAWGLWAGGGMGGSGEVVSVLGKHGIMPMSPELAVSALWQSLDRTETVLVAANIDWTRFAPSVSAVRRQPLLNDLPEARNASTLEEISEKEDRTIKLVERLGNLSLDERKRTLLDLVNGEAAAILRLASVDPDRSLYEVGLDSLMSVELRNRLSIATGLKLPATTTLDYQTPEKLAAFLLTHFDDSPIAVTVELPVSSEDEAGHFIQVLRQAQELKADDEVWNIAQTAIRVRLLADKAQKHTSPDIQDESPVQLALGPDPVRLVCFPHFLVPSGPFGPMAYLSFKSMFNNRRDVWCIPHYGYREGQLLMERDEFIASRSTLVLNCVGEAPFVLLGHCLGGRFAHLIAGHLEQIGRPPRGLVIADAPTHTLTSEGMRQNNRFAISRSSLLGGNTDASFTAMMWFTQMIAGDVESGIAGVNLYAQQNVEQKNWKTVGFSGPVLHIAATEPFEDLTEGMWHMRYPLSTLHREAPGNHITMLQKSEMGRIVNDWISSTFECEIKNWS
jgi:short-subunit dehydrogenase/acyl carrier protein